MNITTGSKQATATCRRAIVVALAGGLWLAASAGGVWAQAPDAPTCADTATQTWWQCVRAQRLAAIDAYITQNKAAFTSFKNAPLATKRAVFDFVGIPMVMFRLLPVLFPDIWGEPAAQMANIGLGPDPFEPGTVMPLGTGYALSAGFKLPGGRYDWKVNDATLTCMACHSGPEFNGGIDWQREPGLLADLLGYLKTL